MSIVDKVRAKTSKTVAEVCSVRKPFGLNMFSNYAGSVPEPFPGGIPLIYSNRVGYSRPDQIERNHQWIDRWKVLIPKAGDGHGRDVSYVLGEPIAVAPGSACTQTYLIAGMFDTADETANFAYYLAGKFARFLVLQPPEDGDQEVLRKVLRIRRTGKQPIAEEAAKIEFKNGVVRARKVELSGAEMSACENCVLRIAKELRDPKLKDQFVVGKRQWADMVTTLFSLRKLDKTLYKDAKITDEQIVAILTAQEGYYRAIGAYGPEVSGPDDPAPSRTMDA
mgnify:CR=1 FL=1